MIRLYHYGRIQDIPTILVEGLKRGQVILRSGQRAQVVWLTQNPDFRRQAWATEYGEHAAKAHARYAIDIPSPPLPAWATSQAPAGSVNSPPELHIWDLAKKMLDPQWAAIKNMEFRGTDDWFFYQGIIRPEWIQTVDLREAPPGAPPCHWGRGNPQIKKLFDHAPFPIGDIEPGDTYPDVLREAAPLMFTHPTDLGVGLLARHVACDWGDVTDKIRAKNEHGLRTGGQIMSAYKLPTGKTVVIMTLLGVGRTIIETGESLGLGGPLGQGPTNLLGQGEADLRSRLRSAYQRFETETSEVPDRNGHTLEPRTEDLTEMLVDLIAD